MDPVEATLIQRSAAVKGVQYGHARQSMKWTLRLGQGVYQLFHCHQGLTLPIPEILEAEAGER